MGDQSIMARAVPVLVAKAWALRALWRICRYLRNWRDVWGAYRRSQPLPVLQFRRGFRLHHGSGDNPMLLLHTVFAASILALDQSGACPADIGANIAVTSIERGGRRFRSHELNPPHYRHRNAGERPESRVRTWEAVAGTARRRLGRRIECAVQHEQRCDWRGGAVGADGVARLRNVPRGPRRRRSRSTRAGSILESLPAAPAIDELVLDTTIGLFPERDRCHEVLVRAGFECRCTPFTSYQGLLVATRSLPAAGQASPPMAGGGIGR
jgi:hypothetical protein